MKTNNIFAIVSFLLTASFVFAEGDGVFKVENDQSDLKMETIAIEYKPFVSNYPQPTPYVLRGRIRYHDVEGTALLNLRFVLPDNARYSTRTLPEHGTLQAIQGTSGWREFELPFICVWDEHNVPILIRPSELESVILEIGIAIPGKGTIELSGLQVSDFQIPVTVAEDKAMPNSKAIPTPLPDGVEVFKVENDQSAPKTERVATIEFRPSREAYIVCGRVQYRDVEGIAYLEMWSVMPDGKRYFTRTLEDIDPGQMASNSEPVLMRRISGTSDWRRFALPFYLMELKPESVTLEINIVMPGKGTIEVTGLTVSDLRVFPDGEWFDARATNMLGGILGTLLGCYGALFGILCSILVPHGKGKRLLYGMVLFAGIMGIFSLVIGLTAVLYGQPYHVWYPFVLLGVITVFVFPFPFLTIRQQYKQVELRKMQALDA